jgi:hypothetical protein
MAGQARRTVLTGAGTATLLVLLAGCASSGTAAGSAPSASGARTASTTVSTTAKPLGVDAPPAVPSSLPPTASNATRDPVRLSGRTDAGLGGTPEQQIGLVYDAWMTDLSGLLDYLSQDWLTAISEITTEKMSQAAAGAAEAVKAADDHGIGTLVDSHRVITVTGDKAELTDCLDELHWYVVESKNGKPDPSVSRGYFVGSASFVRVDGQWKVSAWNSHPERCTF